MGPRPRGRGIRTAPDFPWQTRALQCGHGRAAVESSQVAITETLTDRLQCGHGRAAVESAGALDRARLGPAASMWPRPRGRGIKHSPVRPARVIEASMWPRPRGRGIKWRADWEASTADPLQCGHGRAAVESLMPRTLTTRHRPASMWPRPAAAVESFR